MGDDNQAELDAVRARVYGRAEVDPGDVAQLVELEQRAAPTGAPGEPGVEALTPTEQPPVDDAKEAHARAESTGKGGRRGILVATVVVVAAGALVAGLFADSLQTTRERASATSTVTLSPPTPEFPEEFTASYLRVSTWWDWDAEFLLFGGSVDGAVIWVGMVGGQSEVCLVFDEDTSATILCNPTGDYPSSFEWVKSTDPSPGTYRLTLEQTGEVDWTFEPAG